MTLRRNAVVSANDPIDVLSLMGSTNVTTLDTTTISATQSHENKLGSGGEGSVYKWGTDYAIKCIKIDDDIDSEIEKAHQEQYVLASSGVGQLHDIFISSGHIWKVYDQYAVNLSDYIETFRDGMDENILRPIIRDICGCIEKLHKANYIHRDIKPDNIMFSGDDDCWKCIDYDMIKYNYSGDHIQSYFAGTVGFTAPEISEWDEENLIDFGVDIWAIGVIIISCINGGDIGIFEVCDDEWDEDNHCVLFDKYYHRVFGKGDPFKQYINGLYHKKVVSKRLYALLYNGIFVKNTVERMSIGEVMMHSWFESDDEDISDLSGCGTESGSYIDTDYSSSTTESTTDTDSTTSESDDTQSDSSDLTDSSPSATESASDNESTESEFESEWDYIDYIDNEDEYDADIDISLY